MRYVNITAKADKIAERKLMTNEWGRPNPMIAKNLPSTM
jgi:hypothetical protein